MKKSLYLYASVLLLFFASCGNNSEETKTTVPLKTVEVNRVSAPDFNADSAYSFVKAQVDFGPRVPGTPSHSKCADFLVTKLKSFGLETLVQKGTVQTFDKKQFSLKNIIASFKPEAQNRILICSHWDTRPWADEDDKDADKPFDSANDGPSGVGVAMEIARQLQVSQPAIGVDIIFFDMEDYGTSGNNESWCLGSQYWAEHLHKPNYYANFGVLLDMVGGSNALFPKEKKSVEYASTATDKVWKTANDAGFGNYFSPQVKEFVGVDDHVFVNKAGIPCMDIIE
jgi:glutaminyl-peptide cyclotransferase